jgi:hypothetical protein
MLDSMSSIALGGGVLSTGGCTDFDCKGSGQNEKIQQQAYSSYYKSCCAKCSLYVGPT